MADDRGWRPTRTLWIIMIAAWVIGVLALLATCSVSGLPVDLSAASR